MKELFTGFFRSTSTWEENDKTMKINREQLINNQCPESWSWQVAWQALEKIIREGKNKKNMAEKKKPCDIRPECTKMQIQQFRVFSSEPSELAILKE